ISRVTSVVASGVGESGAGEAGTSGPETSPSAGRAETSTTRSGHSPPDVSPAAPVARKGFGSPKTTSAPARGTRLSASDDVERNTGTRIAPDERGTTRARSGRRTVATT